MFVELDTSPSPPSPRSPARSSRSRSPRAPQTEQVTLDTLPRIRPFLANSAGPVRATSSRPPSRCARPRRRSPPRSRRARRSSPAPTSSTASCRRPRVAAAASTTTPPPAPGSPPPTVRHRPARPGARASSPRRRRSATTLGILAGNLTGVFTGGNDLGSWQRFIVFDVPKGPNNEGSPSSGIANGGGPDNKQLPPLQPVPEHRRARADVRVRGRQRAVQGRPGRDRQRARQPGHRHRGPDQARRAPDGAVLAATKRPVEARSGQAGAATRGSTAATTAGPSPWVWGLIVAADHRPPASTSRSRRRSRSRARASSSTPSSRTPTTLRATSPVRIAGVNVGKVTEVEREGDAVEVTFTRRRGGPADPRGRDGRDPAAAVPRGQLLPRPRPGQPERAGARRRRRHPGHPDGDRGPDRRGPDGAAGADPQGPAAGAARASAPRSPTSRPRPTTSARTPTSPARPAAEALNDVASLRRARRARHGDRQRGAARREPARPLRPDPRPARCSSAGSRATRPSSRT